jgi:hypothetical protein
MKTVACVQGVQIRLTDERWTHIVTAHADMREMQEAVLSCIEDPEFVVRGDDDEFIAIRELRTDRWLCVVYRIETDDGFVISAFRISRDRYFRRRKPVWP